MIKLLFLIISSVLFVAISAKDHLIYHAPIKYLDVQILKEHLEEKFSHIKDLEIVTIAFDTSDYCMNSLMFTTKAEYIKEILAYINKIDAQA